MNATSHETAEPLTGLGKAFLVFIKWLVGLVVDTAKEHSKGTDAPVFIDARSCVALGLPRKTFLRLTRQGAFPTHRAGKTILADRDAVVTYIRTQNGAKPRAARAPFDGSSKDINEMSPDEFYGKGK
jgi:hypothetical protein